MEIEIYVTNRSLKVHPLVRLFIQRLQNPRFRGRELFRWHAKFKQFGDDCREANSAPSINCLAHQQNKDVLLEEKILVVSVGLGILLEGLVLSENIVRTRDMNPFRMFQI